MSSSNPFDDVDQNPFFDTVKENPINEDVVFGGGNADEPEPTEGAFSGAPVPDMAVPSGSISPKSSSTPSNSAILFGMDDSADETKPINFDDEQSKQKSGSKNKDLSLTDKAVSAAANLLFESDDGEGKGEGENQKPKRKWYDFWKPSFYQPYFDVDTKDVLMRCFVGLVPIGKPFFERVQGNPDVYGPFWVTTTILFLLAISSNFAEYIAYHNQGVSQHWEPDFFKVCIAAAVFYAYLILLPIIIWALQRFLAKAKNTYIQVLCVYGYSMTAFLVVTPFCIFPYEWVRWAVIILACVVSCVCFSVALFRSLKQDMVKGVIVIVVALVFQAALALTYKVYFFSKIEVPTSFSSSQ